MPSSSKGTSKRVNLILRCARVAHGHALHLGLGGSLLHSLSSLLCTRYGGQDFFTARIGLASRSVVDLVRFELTTSSMPWKRAPNCATGPLWSELFHFNIHWFAWTGIRRGNCSANSRNQTVCGGM